MKVLQDTPCYTSMFGEGLQVDQDVVKVYTYQALHDEVSENVIHHGLEGGQTVGKAKKHHQRLEQPSVGSEGSLPLVTLLDSDIIVPPANIQLGEILRPSELVYELRDERDWISVLDSHRIQGSIVLDQSEGAILLLDEEHR